MILHPIALNRLRVWESQKVRSQASRTAAWWRMSVPSLQSRALPKGLSRPSHNNIRDKSRVRNDLCLSADDQSEHLPVWRQYPSTNDENQNDGVSEKLCWNLVKLPSVNSIHLPLSRLLGVKRSYYRVLVWTEIYHAYLKTKSIFHVGYS